MGPGGILKTGSGTLGMRSSSGNTYSGGTTINEGVVEGRGNGYFGNISSAITLNGGTLRIAAFPATNLVASLSHPIHLFGNSSAIQVRAATVTIGNGIDGPGSLNLTCDASWTASPNRLTFSGNNTFSGGTMLSYITVSLTGSSTLGTGPISLKQGAVLSPASAANFAPMQKVTMQSDSVYVLNDGVTNPASVIQSIPPNTDQSVLALAHRVFTQPLDMATIGSGKMYLGSAGDYADYKGFLQPCVDNIYRLGGGSTYISFQPRLLLGGGVNQLTGTASVLGTM